MEQPRDQQQEETMRPGSERQTERPSELQPEFQTEEKKPATAVADIVLAWGCFLLCWLLMQARSFAEHPLGVFLTFGGISVCAIVYLRIKCKRLAPKGLVAWALCALLSVSLITNGNKAIRLCVMLFLILAFPFCVSGACGIERGWFLHGDPFGAFFRSLSSLPFRHVKDFFISLFGLKGAQGKKVGKVLIWLFLGLFAAVVPTGIIILLLSYDDLFIDLLARTFDLNLDFRTVSSPLFAIPCAMILFGVLFTAVRIATAEEERTLPKVGTVPMIPCVILCAAVTPILIVYILFFVSQMPYYLSAFTGVRPEELSYANYAREGFFQLCFVSGINAAMLLAFSFLMRNGTRGRSITKRIYSSILSLFTLVLIATALSKMALYIRYYGLTQKRVYSSWLMLLLAVAFILVLIRQIFPKFHLSAALAVAMIVFALLITVPNVDSAILSYNVNAYVSGQLATVDLDMLGNDLSSSSASALISLKEHLEAIPDRTPTQDAYLHFATASLERLRSDLSSRSVFSYSVPDLIAKRMLK